MYNTDDVVNGVTTLDCFNCLLEMAFDSKENEETKEKCFDVLRRCMGIDFSMQYIISMDVLLNCDYSDETIDSYEANSYYSLESAKAEIKRNFKEFEWMVSEGKFNPSYLKFLQRRLGILEELLHYSDTYRSVMEASYNSFRNNPNIEARNAFELEAVRGCVMTDKLKSTRKLLEERIEEVKRNLKETQKLTKTM